MLKKDRRQAMRKVVIAVGAGVELHEIYRG